MSEGKNEGGGDRKMRTGRTGSGGWERRRGGALAGGEEGGQEGRKWEAQPRAARGGRRFQHYGICFARRPIHVSSFHSVFIMFFIMFAFAGHLNTP